MVHNENKWRRLCWLDFRQPRVNFINILRTHFLYKNLLSSFSLLRIWLWTNFCMKNAGLKCWWNWPLQSTTKQIQQNLESRETGGKLRRICLKLFYFLFFEFHIIYSNVKFDIFGQIQLNTTSNLVEIHQIRPF